MVNEFEQYICKGCDEIIPFKGHNFNYTYCTHKCCLGHQKILREEKLVELFYSGKMVRRNDIYKMLVIRDGNICSVCNITEWNEKPIRLWVDHIDGDASNNQPNNFRLICPNCDSQSETFGAKNIGKGRKSRGLPQYG